MTSNNNLIAAAIDFGTTYSGSAFSYKHQYDTDPTKVTAKQWHSGQSVSLKAPTTVLIKPDGKTLDSFGYEAERKYMDLVSEDNYKDWYYFRRFKMTLHGKMTFDRNLPLMDETNKSLPAINVFSMAIRYLRDDLFKNMTLNLAIGEIKEDDIMWILTVPAIWDDAAKQFMREAAMMAGIKESKLKIALEPETASIFCCLLPVEKTEVGGRMSHFKTGSKYMVVDAGGGTVDITVHEVLPGNKLKEIHKASGGNWGGTQVDEAFKHFVISLVGEDVFRRFEEESKEDYLGLFKDFEIKKRDVSPDNDTKVTFHFPTTLRDIFCEERGHDIRSTIKTENGVLLVGDKLRINASVIKQLFSGVIQNMVSHIQDLLKVSKVQEISSILMVGGFSESKMLQHAIKSNFPNVRIVIPPEAGLVVLKGAVIFGHSPYSILERVCKYTYGIQTTSIFDESIHDDSKRLAMVLCRDIFDKHVEMGQTVAVNENTAEQSYRPLLPDQAAVNINIYASTKRSPMYVTDEGCQKLGSITVHIRDMSVPVDQRSVSVSMCFGGTEIEVTAKEKKTGEITRATVNFLG